MILVIISSLLSPHKIKENKQYGKNYKDDDIKWTCKV